MNKSIEFFDTQFRRQVDGGELPLNPFEAATLPFLHGRVLDFGCGLGNLAIAAARQGCSVTALDASPTAIRHLNALAVREGLSVTAREADLRNYVVSGEFDAVVAIGLLMFFDCATAWRQLGQLKDSLCPGGICAINVLVEGTSFMEMFDPDAYCLFRPDDLSDAFAGWDVLAQSRQEFAAPGDTLKAFVTLIARKPRAA